MALSADGRFIAFTSYGNDLDPSVSPNFHQLYIRDRVAGTTIPTGIGHNYDYRVPSNESVWSFSADGRFLTFTSYGEHPSFGGGKNASDVFVLDRSLDRSVRADLKISQSVNPGSFAFQQPITYTLSAVNQGGSGAESVNVIDRLPGSARLLSATASQGSCSGERILVCRLGSLAPGAIGTVTLTVEPKWALTSSLTNSVSVNAAPLDPDLTNNRSVVSILGVTPTPPQ
jgi:uncharacterized repeat protein (TIGR01451 family)